MISGSKRLYRGFRGSSVIMMMGLIIMTLIASALAIDMAFSFLFRNQLQMVADSAALAGANDLFRSTTPASGKPAEVRSIVRNMIHSNMPNVNIADSDIILGYVDPAVKAFNPNTFTISNNNSNLSYTGGYNAVFVRVPFTSGSQNGPLPTIMAKMFGVKSMENGASAVAMADQSVNAITNGGIRPIYACQGQYNMAMQDGNPNNNVVRIYGQQFYIDGQTVIAGCPAPGSGNWGFADLRNCNANAVGNSTLGDWFMFGYPGTVSANQCYSTQPGNAISGNNVTTALDTLIANKTQTLIPIMNTFNGNGSNTNVNVVGFAGFVFTGYKATGSANSRYIEGYFTRTYCKQGCSSSGTISSGTAGIANLRLVGTQYTN